jgi:hypothetical protein
MIDVQHLRAITSEAIRNAEVERVARLEAEDRAQREKSDRAQREAEAKADRILSQVPERCGLEAKAGRSFAIIMSLKSYEDYDIDHDHRCRRNDSFSFTWLKGAAKLVYERLVADGVPVKFDYWHDGVGVQSGFNLLVTW